MVRSFDTVELRPLRSARRIVVVRSAYDGMLWRAVLSVWILTPEDQIELRRFTVFRLG